MKIKLSFPARLSLNTLLISFAGVFIISYTTMYLANQLLENQMVNRIQADLRRESESFQAKISTMESNIRLLASSQEIKGVIRASNEYSYDPQENVSLDNWKQRLALLFESMMRQNKSYYSIRLISVESNGLEKVRIDRIEERYENVELYKNTRQNHLKFFRETISLKPGEVYISDIGLHRENGKIATPLRPTVKLSVPIFGDKDIPYGIISINADFSLLTNSLDYTSIGSEYIMTNNKGQYLYHGNKEKPFAFEFEDKSSLPDDFNAHSKFSELLNWQDETKEINLNENERLVMRRIFLGVDNPQQKTIVLSQRIDLSMWRANDSKIRNTLLLTIFVTVGLIATVSFIHSSKMSEPILQLTHISRRIARGERDVEIPIAQEDEVGALAESIRSMVHHLEQSQEDLRDLNNSLEEKVTERTRTIQNRNNAIEASLTGIVIAGQDGVITYCNRAFYETFGYPSARTARQYNLIGIWAERKKGVHFLEMLTNEKTLRDEFSAKTFDDREINVEVFAALTTNKEGESEMVASFADITERKHAELTLQKMSLALEHSASIVYITDTHNTIEYVNKRFTEVTGYSNEAAIGRTPELLRSEETDWETYENLLATIQSGKSWHGEILNRKKDGELFWNRQSISQIYNDDNKITHYISVGEDVTSIKESHSKIEQMAYYDALTQLPNRRLFKDRLEQALIHCLRSQENLALLYLDLDGFKNINDTLGHDAGDAFLKEVAARLTATLRAEDVVARLGGDEFSIILKDIRDSEAAGNVADKILHRIQDPIMVNNRSIVASASIGITIVPDDGNNIEALLKNADMAMYRAKDKGKNNWQFFTEEMNRSAMSRLTIEQDLRSALDKDQFQLRYQPIVDLQTNRIKALEALIRWEHPEKGLISPLKFIGVAEETGMIIPIGRWVLEEAARMMREVRKRTNDDIHIAVNLSPRQFQDPKLFELVDSLHHNDSLNWLEVEITEGMLIKDVASTIDKLNQIRAKGISVAIDDFGTGYSSLSYLQELPLNKLKIDRSFIKDLPGNDGNRKLTHAIVTMAKGLDLKIVAEGIETDEQRALMADFKCDFGQGYFFYKPLSKDELLAELSKEQNTAIASSSELETSL